MLNNGVGLRRSESLKLQITDPRHIGGDAEKRNSLETGNGEFKEFFLGALDQVNELQIQAMEKQKLLITSPDSVEIHDVTIAIAQANLAISAAKQISDSAIRAYREIINVR